MRRVLLSICTVLVLLMAWGGAALAAEDELDVGMGFDIGTFFDNVGNDGIADADNPVLANAPFIGVGSVDGFSCSPSGNTSCNLYVQGTKQFEVIKAPRTNGIGDVGIIRQFSAQSQQHYAAVASVAIKNVNLVVGSNFWARLTVVGVDAAGGQPGLECSSTLLLSRNGITDPSNPDPVAEILEIPDCQLPNGTVNVLVKVRAHSNNLNAGGTVVVNNLSFRRLS